MIPVNATATAVRIDASRAIPMRNRLTRSPSDCASMSPMTSRFRSRESATAVATPRLAIAITTRVSVQVAPSSPPASQKIISRCAVTLSVERIMAETAALKNALTATPVSSSAAMENLAQIPAIAMTVPRAAAAPMPAAIGTAMTVAPMPNESTITAPRAPPAEVPMMPGSASGLRNIACMSAPAVANAVPTASAIATLGMRTVSTIACSAGLTFAPSAIPMETRMAVRAFGNGILNGPIVVASVATATVRASRMAVP